MEISDKIGNIAKGKSSLTEALKQLDIAKQAFQQSEEVKELLGRNQIEMNNLKNSMNQMININYFKTRLDDLMLQIEANIRKKFDEFSTVYFGQLSAKISLDDIDAHLNKKVG